VPSLPNLTATIPSLNQSPALIARVFGGVQLPISKLQSDTGHQ
jgi:hypothetical protein